MANASQDNTTLDTRTRIDLVQAIFRFIQYNALDEIMEILVNLHPEKRIKILNSTIYGVSPLYAAVKANNFKISHFLLRLSLRQGRRQLSEIWKNSRHPLIAAFKVGNVTLIENILLHLCDINECIDGTHSPLMIAIFIRDLTSVKLMVALGADINRPCFHGRTPLMESTPHKEMCRFLLVKGANVYHQDDEGFTALHLAITKGHSDSIVLLVNAGADVRIRNHENMTPLIWASMNLKIPSVLYLNDHPCSTMVEMIESVEILGVGHLCAQKSVMEPWMKSLRARKRENLPKKYQAPAREILDFSQEFTTESELEKLQGNRLHLAYQSILVVERILGINNRLYMQILLETTLIAKKENNMKKVKQFIDYIEEYCTETSVYFVVTFMQTFKSLFYELGKDSDPNNVFEYHRFVIFKIIAEAALKLWSIIKNNVYINPFVFDSNYFGLVETFLFMTSSTKTGNISQQILGEFKEGVTKVVREDLRVGHHQSILHFAIKLMNIRPWASVQLIGMLLRSGADANSEDYFGRTPIMYAVNHAPKPVRKNVLALLEKYGGRSHTNVNEGFRAMEDILDAHMDTNLKTRRRLKRKYTEVTTYIGVLPEVLENVTNFH